MKIELIRAASSNTLVLRFFAFSSAELHGLRETAEALASGTQKQIELATSAHQELLNLAGVRLSAGTRDIGAIEPDRDHQITWELTPESWRDVATRIEPLLTSPSGFQWLDENGPVSVLASASGKW